MTNFYVAVDNVLAGEGWYTDGITGIVDMPLLARRAFVDDREYANNPDLCVTYIKLPPIKVQPFYLLVGYSWGSYEGKVNNDVEVYQPEACEDSQSTAILHKHIRVKLHKYINDAIDKKFKSIMEISNKKCLADGSCEILYQIGSNIQQVLLEEDSYKNRYNTDILVYQCLPITDGFKCNYIYSARRDTYKDVLYEVNSEHHTSTNWKDIFADPSLEKDDDKDLIDLCKSTLDLIHKTMDNYYDLSENEIQMVIDSCKPLLNTIYCKSR